MNVNLTDIKKQENSIWQELLVNMMASLCTLVVALFSGSLLLLSDGFDYARSLTTGFVSLRILRRIRKGQTRNYDYGAGKLECLGSLMGAGLFMSGLLGLAVMAMLRLRNGSELHLGFTIGGILIQVVEIIVNGFWWLRNKRIALRTHAPLIEMQWHHNRTDALSSISVVIALSLMLLLRDKSWSTYIDPVCTLLYVVFSIGLYLPVVRNNLFDLLDRTLEEDLQIKIMRRLAEHFDQYEAFHGVRSRRSGSRIFIDIILGFHPERKVGETASTIKTLRNDLEADIPRSTVNVIMEPM